MHPSCRHAAIASDWLPYGYVGQFARVSASQESCGTVRKKLGGYFGGFGGAGGAAGSSWHCSGQETLYFEPDKVAVISA